MFSIATDKRRFLRSDVSEAPGRAMSVVIAAARAESFRRALYPCVTFVALVVLWEGWIRIGKVPLYIVPPPSAIAVGMATRAEYLTGQTLVTLQEIVLGFGLSVVLALPLALGVVFSTRFRQSAYPLIIASQVVPKVAIAPLFLIWFGFGITTKVLAVLMIAFFPIVINAVIGFQSIEIEKIYLAQSMGASKWSTFWKIRLPQALPNIFGGLKLAATFSVIGAVVGEFIGAEKGVGHTLLVANGNLDTVLLFSAVGYLTIVGVLIFAVMDTIERFAIPWHVSRRGGAAQSI